MKKLTIIGSALLLAGGWQLVQAQQAGGGGGGGRGGFGMTFDAINTDKDNHEMMGEGDDAHEVQVLSKKEVETFFNERFAGRAGGGGPQGGGGGRGGFDIDTIFASWDADGSGGVTEEEFNNRPRGRRGGGPGGAPQ